MTDPATIAEAARAEERAAIVAWLREGARLHRWGGNDPEAAAMEFYADYIERGQHRAGEETVATHL